MAKNRRAFVSLFFTLVLFVAFAFLTDGVEGKKKKASGGGGMQGSRK